MENRKIINLLDNSTNQPSKIRTKTWVEVNDDICGTYNTNSKIKFYYNFIIKTYKNLLNKY